MRCCACQRMWHVCHPEVVLSYFACVKGASCTSGSDCTSSIMRCNAVYSDLGSHSVDMVLLNDLGWMVFRLLRDAQKSKVLKDLSAMLFSPCYISQNAYRAHTGRPRTY